MNDNSYTILCPYCEEKMILKGTNFVTNKSYIGYEVKIHECTECKSRAEAVISGNSSYISVNYRKYKKEFDESIKGIRRNEENEIVKDNI